VIVAAVLYIIGIVFLTAFLIVFVGRVDWRARIEGTHLVATIVMMLINAGLAVSVILLGAFPGLAALRLIAALAFAVVAVGMLVGLVRVQRRGETLRNGSHARTSI